MSSAACMELSYKSWRLSHAHISRSLVQSLSAITSPSISHWTTISQRMCSAMGMKHFQLIGQSFKSDVISMRICAHRIAENLEKNVFRQD